MTNPKANFDCPHCNEPVEVEVAINKVVHVEQTPEGKLAWQADLEFLPHKPNKTQVDGPEIKKS